MPTPIDIFLDPISLSVLGLYAVLIAWEAQAPARKLPVVTGWLPRTLATFIAYFLLSSYLPLLWDKYLAPFQVIDLQHLGTIGGAVAGLLVYNLLHYAWHRSMHASDMLWRIFHQMHHSAERLDTYGAFYMSPWDMVGFTLVGSLALVAGVGITAEAATVFLFAAMFFAIFQHTNVRTPRWLGYFVQRPESHNLHHGKGLHRYNYADLPIFDIIGGTFRNPASYEMETGFYDGASSRVGDMLMFRDVSEPEHPRTAENAA